MVIVTDRKKY